MAITFSQLLTAQNIKYNKDIQEKTLIFDTSDISELYSNCDAFYNKNTNTLSTDTDCKAYYWFNDLPNLNNPYEFVFDFSMDENFKKVGYALQIFLGNTKSGERDYTWIGVKKNGELLISYKDNQGYTDLLTIRGEYKVEANKLNKLKFVQFPDGVFYIEFNSFSKWSYDLIDSKQKIPIVGLGTKISFRSNIIIRKLELNVLKDSKVYPEVTKEEPTTDDLLTKMENTLANSQANQLLSIETDKERIEFRNSMRILFDDPCYGNCKNGYGVYDYDGGQYMGEWKNGQFEGNGILYIEGDMFYKGSFENGVMHGYGKVYDNGELIGEGQFKNGEPVDK